MKPAPFLYAAPSTVGEALQVLHDGAPEARVLAGGQSMMPLMNLRMSRPEILVDIQSIPDLARWRISDGHVEIGAMVRQRSFEREPELRGALPLLADAIRHVGHVATRSRGTVVGSLCHADPAGEMPICAIALDAELDLHSVDGIRTLTADEFFDDALVTNARPNELVAAVRFPMLRGSSGCSFQELARRHGDFAIVAVGCVVVLDEAERIGDARIALGGVAGRPIRSTDAEARLKGQRPGSELFQEVGRIVGSCITPGSDLHASAKYRRSVAATLVERALSEAAERANRAAKGP